MHCGVRWGFHPHFPDKGLRPLTPCSLRAGFKPQSSIGYEKAPAKAEAFSYGIRQRPTLPERLHSSTIGAERLNFCVRYGNRWDPFAIVTGIFMRVSCSPLSSWFPQRLFITAASFLETSRTLSRFSVIYAYPENRTSRFLSPCEKPIFNFPFGLT